MRSTRTLSLYMMREVSSYTALGVLAITTVMVTQNLFRFLDEMISANVRLVDFGAIVGALCLMLATYSVPIAFLFGVLLAFGRLSSDTEITAMQSCGIGLRSLMVPMVILGLATSAATAYLIGEVEHRAQLSLRQTVKTMAARGGFVQPGRFRRLGERVLFVRHVDPDNRLEGVLISDRTAIDRPLMIFAESGDLRWDAQHNELQFRLRNGDIHVEPVDEEFDDDADYQRISFATFDYRLDAESLFGRDFSTLRPREMTLEQLRAVVARAEAGESLEDLRRANPAHYELQIQRRFALPAAPLLFAFVGAPLGLRRRRGARSWGAIACVVLVFGYYAFLTLGEFLALEHLVPAAAALWLPNGVFALAALVLLWRAGRRRG